MEAQDRARFDALLSDALEAMPAAFRGVVSRVPVIVEDRPGPGLIKQLQAEGVLPPGDEDLLGLHTGVAITEEGPELSGVLPATIHVCREPIVELVGGWGIEHAEEEIYEEIRTTLLHEIGHHFGLDEDDLEHLGYG